MPSNPENKDTEAAGSSEKMRNPETIQENIWFRVFPPESPDVIPKTREAYDIETDIDGLWITTLQRRLLLKTDPIEHAHDSPFANGHTLPIRIDTVPTPAAYVGLNFTPFTPDKTYAVDDSDYDPEARVTKYINIRRPLARKKPLTDLEKVYLYPDIDSTNPSDELFEKTNDGIILPKRKTAEFQHGLRFRIWIPSQSFMRESHGSHWSQFYLPDYGRPLPQGQISDGYAQQLSGVELEAYQDAFFATGNHVVLPDNEAYTQQVYGIFIPPWIENDAVPPPPRNK